MPESKASSNQQLDAILKAIEESNEILTNIFQTGTTSNELLSEILEKIEGGTPSPNPPSDKWPNEPAGFVSITDWDMSDSPNGLYGDDPLGNSGWKIVSNHAPGSIFGPNMGPEFDGTPAGWCVSAQYGDAPYSPENVYKFVYPKGMRLGTAPATPYKPLPVGREFYCAWMCAISNPFDYSTNGQKMCFLFTNSNGQIFLSFGPDKQVVLMPEFPDPPPSSPDYRIRRPNCPPEDIRLFTPGEWHLIEWHTRTPDHNDPANSINKWWVDGILQGEYTDVWNRDPYTEFKMSPTFGGNGDIYKAEEDYWLVDHTYISVPGSSLQVKGTVKE